MRTSLAYRGPNICCGAPERCVRPSDGGYVGRESSRVPGSTCSLTPARWIWQGRYSKSVYRRSWKDAEPHPDFNVALMRAMAERGWLRLGVWSIGTEPVAVQFWVIHARQAIVLKLAHDETFKAHSPGTVLTALMIRHLLDNEHIAQIDLGRGDDAYKQGWAVERRQRIGVLLINPWQPAGLIALMRHASGRIAASGLRLRMGPEDF